jgi:signal peptidase I
MFQTVILIAFLGELVWVIFNFGIELALVIGTLVSGIVWFSYRLIKGKDAKQTAPYLIDNARSFFPIFLIVLLLRGFVVEPFRIPSGSMMPTLLVGDFILVNKFNYGLRMPVTKDKFLDIGEPKRGDSIVFRWPQNPRLDYIKRLIGVPGDKVRYFNKTVYLNGEPLALTPVGPYEPEGKSGERARHSLEAIEDINGVKHAVLINPRAPDFGISCNFMRHDEVEVPPGHYLVMGDNRDDSNDGRCWGFVPEENLVGKAFFIWFNWDWERPGFVNWRRIGQSIQ